MSVPDVLAQALGDEPVAEAIDLGGEDVVAFTPTRALCYRGEGLLSDERVDELPYDAQAVRVEEGRRSHTVTLDYGYEGERSLGVPPDRLDDVLPRLLEGVLGAAGVIADGESIDSVHRFDELAIVLTDQQYVKHVGDAVWATDADVVPYAALSAVEIEDGSVGAQVVIRTPERVDRIKTEAAAAHAFYDALEDAVCAVRDCASLSELPGDDDATADADDGGGDPIESVTTAGIDRLDEGADAPADGGGSAATAATTGSTARGVGRRNGGPAAATSEPDLSDVADRLDDIERRLDEQEERLDAQAEQFEQLLEELRRGR